MFANLRLGPFLLGGLLYAVAYGMCDYNYWGAWVLNLKDILDAPCVILLQLVVSHASNPEGSVWGFLSVAALLLNAHIYGAALSLVVALFTSRGSKEAIQPPQTTTGSSAPDRV